jgi:hypothetical protein
LFKVRSSKFKVQSSRFKASPNPSEGGELSLLFLFPSLVGRG